MTKMDSGLSGYLYCDAYTLSEGTGGVINFTLDATAVHGNRNYLILGTMSGTKPGHPLPGGYVTMPLNFDDFTFLVFQLKNGPFLPGFMGILNPSGRGWAQLNTLGPIPGLAGTVIHFGYALNPPWDFVSNPISVEIVN